MKSLNTTILYDSNIVKSVRQKKMTVFIPKLAEGDKPVEINVGTD